ncbi:hypothetical protein QT381_04305 [Galbitalea sp. SE-J8]|uniref:hypothetical protein n=1 Tax=Galbitalea sp. SE-J8 TaxID=3054952 RepID=UPI00259D3039|nr:hypothetical protein [Galbitalea sp. SE-J8]MDM4762226.1 hypothetical protein [Galbitalea sp. SE-J8]
MNTSADDSSRTVGSWFARIAEWRAWTHALLAAGVGAVFAPIVRTLGIAAVVGHGVYYLLAAASVLAVALGFAALGRIFTRRRTGWLLALTIVVWLPAIVAISFVVLTTTGSLDRVEPLVPAVGGVVGGETALLAWAGPPRWLALIALIATSASVALLAFNSAS